MPVRLFVGNLTSCLPLTLSSHLAVLFAVYTAYIVCAFVVVRTCSPGYSDTRQLVPQRSTLFIDFWHNLILDVMGFVRSHKDASTQWPRRTATDAHDCYML